MKQDNNMKQRINLSLDKQTITKLEHLSKKHHRSKSSMIDVLVEQAD